MEMQREHTKGGIIWIWQRIDDGVERVAADNVIIDLRCIDEGRVICGGEQRIG